MRNKSFFDAQQAQSYLMGCVIRLNETPIYIVNVLPTDKREIFNLRYRALGEKADQYVLSDSKNMNMVPVPLGMSSLNEKSYTTKGWITQMLYRAPVRQWKVGLCRENLCTMPVIKNGGDSHGSLNDLLLSEELKRTILGDYPSLRTALKWTDNTGKVFAISRRFAVQGRNLFYRECGVPVGYIEGGKITLSPGFTYVQQELEQDNLS